MTKIEILNELNKNKLVASGIENAYGISLYNKRSLSLQGKYNADLLIKLQEAGHKATVGGNGYAHVWLGSEIGTGDKMITVTVNFVFTD